MTQLRFLRANNLWNHYWQNRHHFLLHPITDEQNWIFVLNRAVVWLALFVAPRAATTTQQRCCSYRNPAVPVSPRKRHARIEVFAQAAVLARRRGPMGGGDCCRHGATNRLHGHACFTTDEQRHDGCLRHRANLGVMPRVPW